MATSQLLPPPPAAAAPPGVCGSTWLLASGSGEVTSGLCKSWCVGASLSGRCRPSPSAYLIKPLVSPRQPKRSVFFFFTIFWCLFTKNSVTCSGGNKVGAARQSKEQVCVHRYQLNKGDIQELKENSKVSHNTSHIKKKTTVKENHNNKR